VSAPVVTGMMGSEVWLEAVVFCTYAYSKK
jgi:hypothetical protein